MLVAPLVALGGPLRLGQADGRGWRAQGPRDDLTLRHEDVAVPQRRPPRLPPDVQPALQRRRRPQRHLRAPVEDLCDQALEGAPAVRASQEGC